MCNNLVGLLQIEKNHTTVTTKKVESKMDNLIYSFIKYDYYLQVNASE